VTNSTLVSVSLDVGLSSIVLVAKRAVTVDAVMAGLVGERSGQ
jgi:hypothetical protein